MIFDVRLFETEKNVFFLFVSGSIQNSSFLEKLAPAIPLGIKGILVEIVLLAGTQICTA